MFKSQIRPAFLVFVLLSLITGVIYPLSVTVAAGIFFPRQAQGSLVYRDHKVVGSSLVGQVFDAERYFWPRPSATAAFPYDASLSGGSNLGPSNPLLQENIQQRIKVLRAHDPNDIRLIPVDLVTASASGLDPHISPAAAYYQAGRVARVRNIREAALRKLIDSYIQPRLWGVIGEPVVNVLELNLASDNMNSGV